MEQPVAGRRPARRATRPASVTPGSGRSPPRGPTTTAPPWSSAPQPGRCGRRLAGHALILDDGTQVGVLRGFVALGGDGSAVQAAVPEESRSRAGRRPGILRRHRAEGSRAAPRRGGHAAGSGAGRDLDAPRARRRLARRRRARLDHGRPPPELSRTRTSATRPSGSSSRRRVVGYPIVLRRVVIRRGRRSTTTPTSIPAPRRVGPAGARRRARRAVASRGLGRRRLRRVRGRRRIIEAAGACIERRDRIDHRRGHRPAGRRQPSGGVPVVPRRCDPGSSRRR